MCTGFSVYQKIHSEIDGYPISAERIIANYNGIQVSMTNFRGEFTASKHMLSAFEKKQCGNL